MPEIEVTYEGAVARILLNRPHKRNALRAEDWDTLRREVETLDQSARCVVIAGAGGAFCAGWDIGQSEGEVDALGLVQNVNRALQAVRAVPVPTIAAAAGDCVGGGFGLAFACDMVVAEETARFGVPFRRIGLIPDTGAHYWLRERLGHHKASRLIYTGELIDAAEADRLGLLSDLCPAGTLAERTGALAGGIASGPTAAFRISKAILQSGAGYDETLDLEADGQGRAYATADAREGLASFLAKRPPRFEGR